MSTNRTRRNVRRAAIAASATFLLLLSFVSSWLVASIAMQTGRMSWKTAESLRAVYSPIMWYCDSGLPGAAALTDLWWTLNPPFEGTMRGYNQLRAPLSPTPPPEVARMTRGQAMDLEIQRLNERRGGRSASQRW